MDIHALDDQIKELKLQRERLQDELGKERDALEVEINQLTAKAADMDVYREMEQKLLEREDFLDRKEEELDKAWATLHEEDRKLSDRSIRVAPTELDALHSSAEIHSEIAQAEAASGKQFVKYWLHNAHITVEGKKISKSLGNTIYLHNIVDKGYNPRAFRYWVLTGHYRTPMNFTWEAIEGADQALKRLTRVYLEASEGKEDEGFMKNFYELLGNDLNTAQAIGLMWSTISTLNRPTLRAIDTVLGLGFTEEQAAAKLRVLKGADLPEHVQNLLAEREVARKNKDFSRADELRKEIESQGFVLKDTADGSKVTKE